MCAMYNKSEWKSKDGKYIIIKKYYSCRVLPTGKVGKSIKEERAARMKETGETQKEINRRHRAERLMRVLLDNFKSGDWYLTCTYEDTPPEAEEVKKQWLAFKRKLKALCKKNNKDFRYVGILEKLYGGGRTHGHILMEALPVEALSEVKKLWKYGRVKVEFYGGEFIDAQKLSDYFTKESVAKTASTLQSSKNLVRTEPKKKIIARANTYSEAMNPPKGYRLIKSVSYCGYSSDGYPLVKMMCERIDDFDKECVT